jgi:hypothetical protein
MQTHNQRRCIGLIFVLGMFAIGLAGGKTKVSAQQNYSVKDFVSSAPSGNLVILEALAERGMTNKNADQVRTEVNQGLGNLTVNDELNAKKGLKTVLEEYQKVQRGVEQAESGFKNIQDITKVFILGGFGEEKSALKSIASATSEVIEERSFERIIENTKKVGAMLTEKAVQRALAEYDKTNDLSDLNNKTADQVYEELRAGKYLPQYADSDQLVNAGADAQKAFQGSFIRQLTELQTKGFQEAAEQGRALEKQGYAIKDLRRDVTTIRAQVDGLTSIVDDVQNRMVRAESNIVAVQQEVQTLAKRVDDQGTKILQNHQEVRQLQSLMFEKMTPKEKLEVLNNGFFAGMKKEDRDDLVARIKVAAIRQELIDDSQKFITKSGQVLEIARNFGIDGDMLNTLSQGVGAGQAIAGGIAAFAAQDYLGGVASMSRLAATNQTQGQNAMPKL